MHYSIREKIQNIVNKPKQKGLTDKEKQNSTPAFVEKCDDFFHIYLEIDNNILNKARFEGEGCSISVASTDFLLNLIENKNIDEVKNIISIYNKFLNGEIDSTGYEVLDYFKIIQEHKSRIKCASVSFEAIKGEIKKWTKY